MKHNKYKLYGAILGDLAGQPYEFPVMKGPYTNVKIHNPDSHITDDTVMTLASAASILNGTTAEHEYRKWGEKYPNAGYGKGFQTWLSDLRWDAKRDSYGNGCLMRASPFMWVKDLPGLIKATQCSHNHEDSFLAVMHLWKMYSGQFTSSYGRYRKFEEFKVNSLVTVGFCDDAYDFNKSTHELIIKVIECGGDTDTNASIIGELSNFWQNDITKRDAEYVESKLDSFQLKTLRSFNKEI